ncbi:hypothetical protein [Streptomyces sp. NPDC018031]|uniref:hypothetical protein n=1 Tax=Streptomyces sp. NPDC018031 TaxID=3365033 RepID=UPI003788AD7F
MKDRGAIRSGLVAAVALAAVTGLPGPAGAAPADGDREIAAYRPQGREIRGTATAGNAPTMMPLGSYVDSIGAGETRHYRVRLDGESAAYVSAVAVPRPGSPVSAFSDGVKLSLVSADGKLCDQARPTAEAVDLAYPLAGYAARIPRPGGASPCREAGTYDFAVERTGGRDDDREPARWPLELQFAQEPAVKGGPTAPPSPGSWSTEPPAVPERNASGARERAGGTDFRTAGLVSTGVWKTRIAPGETRFFRVPLGWGQQLYAEAELPGARPPAGGSPADRAGGGADDGRERRLGDAFGVSLYNPMHGLVRRGGFAPYRGERAEDVLERTAPVAYGNRYTRAKSEVEAVSLAGEYYLAVTLHPDAADYFGDTAPVTLRVVVDGERQPGPEYVRDPGAGLGQPPTGPRTAASPGEGENRALRAVAYAGFGTGTALLLGLGWWTVIARRRAGAAGG